MTRYAFTNPGFWWEAVVVNLPIALGSLWCARRVLRMLQWKGNS